MEVCMKKYLSVIPLVCLFCFVVGCQDKEAMAELEKFREQAAVEEQNINLIRDMTKEWDEEGISNLGKYYSSNCVIHYPGGMDVNGLDAIIERNTEFKAAFSNMDHNIEDVVAQGEIVAVRFFGKMTHTGGFQGIPPTGKEVSFTAMEFCRISEGKIVEIWQDADILGLMMQIGMELKPKE
jgi:predicted ester cyclase